MKTLKFKQHLVDLIRAGSKTSTWRLFDDKELQTGDEVELLDWETRTPFALAILDQVREKTFEEVTEADYEEGHERYASLDAMITNFRTYYGDRVNAQTSLKLIRFHVTQWL